MKQTIIILATALTVLPALSQTNEHKRAAGGPGRERYALEEGPQKGREGRKGEHRELTDEEMAQMQERRLAMMEKTLKEIGVSEEQKQQITAQQNRMKEEMRANYLLVEDNKKKLKILEQSGAPEADIFAAIDAVADAQAEQMKILARNRIQMERILGKEKFEQFMDQARSKWKEHGRRRTNNLPPAPAPVDSETPPALQAE